MTADKNKQLNIDSLIHQISFEPEKRHGIFGLLPKATKIELLPNLTPPIQRDLLVHLPDNQLIGLFSVMDPADVTDMLQLFGKRRRREILQILAPELKDTVSQLLEFDPETAAGLMNLDFVVADINDDIVTVSKKFKGHEKRTGRPPVILIKRQAKLAGYLPVHELGFGRAGTKINKLTKNIRSIAYSASEDQVIDLFQSYPDSKVAVVNDAGEPVGVIYSDDILLLLQEQETASLYDFAGVSDEESVTDSAQRKVSLRYKWLIINLATAFLAAFTVSAFESTISKYVLLAVYMPIVAGMGGNAATQTLAVVVRGIALRQIDLRTAFETLRNELGAGFINGLINGFLVALVVLLKDNNLSIAIVLALAMVINLLVAALFGTLVPLLMMRFKKDPATSATVFITTATDVLGFLTFLGLATLVLR